MFVFFLLSYFFHQHAIAITMQLGSVPIDTKIFCNIIVVESERDHHQPLTEGLRKQEQDQYRNSEFFHPSGEGKEKGIRCWVLSVGFWVDCQI